MLSLRKLLFLSLTSLALAVLGLSACSTQGSSRDLGRVTDGKGDAPEIRDREVTLEARVSETEPSRLELTVDSDLAFVVQLRYEGDARTRIAVRSEAGVTEGEAGVAPTLSVPAPQGLTAYTIVLENHTDAPVSGLLSVLGDSPTEGISAEVRAAARDNLARVAREIDGTHLANYGLDGEIHDRFLEALELEYAAQAPDQFEARMKALASMIFFAAPEIQPPAGGKPTPFHGLDMDQFEALMSIEDEIFHHLVDLNGGDLIGVRPFSVCETKYIIETYVRPRAAFPGFDAHKTAYTEHAATCPQPDLDEWYNFRGLGHLRPSWIESNIMDRFLRRMVKNCRSPSSAWTAECEQWDADRLAYRQTRNRQLASRLFFFDPATQEDYFYETNNELVLLEDRNGDGVGEFLRPGPITTTAGETGALLVESTGEFSGVLKLQKANGTTVSTTPRKLVASDALDPAYDPTTLTRPDFGLLGRFSDPTGCTAESLDPASCPLLKRFYVMIDRHEDFYSTYSALNPDWNGISSQPSPLVACSITLGAAHDWDSAGIPDGGNAGFIFLMRIPFKQILAGSRKSVSTLDAAPAVLAIQDLYAGEQLDMSRVWLDIASLSNNLFSSEHEISKFGSVPSEQLEGILVIRRPAAME